MAGTIIFLFGADTYRSHEKLRIIEQRYIDAALGDTNLKKLDGATLTFTDFVRQVMAVPFLAKTRLVVIENLLIAGRKDLQEEIDRFLPKIPESSVVCFFEKGVPDKRNRLFKQLVKNKFVEEFSLLDRVALEKWVRQRVAKLGFSLESKAVQFLIATVGSDLWRMANELSKLAAYAKSGLAASQSTHQPPLLTADQVAVMVFREDQADVFELAAAVARGDSRGGLAALRTLLAQGEAELYILSMITWQFRTLLAAVEAYESGVRHQYDLARAAGIAPFVAQKLLPLLPKLSLPGLLAHHDRLLDYDAAIKTGELEPTQALELLIVELAGSNSTKISN